MESASPRLDDWRKARAALVLGDVAAYGVYAVRRFYRDQGLQAAGALTYTTLLALVPLMTIAFSIFSAFPAFQTMQDRIEVLLFENLVPEVGSVVRSYVSEFSRNATNLTAVGVVALAVSAVLLLSTIESVFNRIWRVERARPLVMRLLIFWTILTLGPVLLGASFSLTSGMFAWIGQLADESAAYVPIALEGVGISVGGRVLAALLQTAAFTVLFVLVPAKPVRLRDAAVGGAIAGVSLEALKWGFRLYVVSFPSYQAIYGALAAIPIFLIWLYLSWTVVIIGAVFAASFSEWRNAHSVDVDADFAPARRLGAAVVVLGVIAERARQGDAASPDALAQALPFDARDGLVEALRTGGYIVTTDEDGYALTRDLHATRLADLARDLELTLGLDPDRAPSPPARRAARRLDAATGRLSERLVELFAAEERILGLSIAEVLGLVDARAEPSVIPLPQGGQQTSRPN